MTGLIHPYLYLLKRQAGKGTAAKGQYFYVGSDPSSSKVKARMQFATGKIIALFLIRDLLEGIG